MHSATLDQHALRVGRVSMAWNGLHETFYSMFAWIVGRENAEGRHDLHLPYGIWHSVQNDTAQRGFLRAAAATTDDKRFIRAINWITAQAEKIGTERNALIHSAVVLTMGDDNQMKTEPSRLSGRKGHLTQFAEKPTMRDWDRVAGNLRVLAQYAGSVEVSQFYPVQEGWTRSWPYRPRLLGLAGSVKPRPPQRKRKPPKPARPRPA